MSGFPANGRGHREAFLSDTPRPKCLVPDLLIPEKSVMPLPSSRLRRNGRNRWNRKALLGLLSSSSLGLAILGGLAFDQLPAAGRSRLGAESAARSRVGEQPIGARARLAPEPQRVEELPAPQQVVSQGVRGGTAVVAGGESESRVTAPQGRSAGRVRLVSGDDNPPMMSPNRS